MLKNIFKVILIMIIGITVGTILLVGVHFLPMGRIMKNVNNSIDLFRSEETYKKVIYGYDNTQLDNYTDALMIQNASYDGKENVIDKAMSTYRYLNHKDQRISLIKQSENQKKKKMTYERYWHGYLVILKPMLMLFSYNDLRIVNTALQLLLVTGIVYLLIKKNKGIYVLPYIISIIAISPITIVQSLQFSTILYISNISMIIMLLFNDKLKEKRRYMYFFLIIGMSTSYFDFLTYPLATLGMPIVLYFILNSSKDLVENIKFIICISIIWGIGYVGMWIGKLIIGSILVNRNFFTSAIEKFKYRSSFDVTYKKITIFEVIKINLKHILIKPYIVLALLLIVYVIYKMIAGKFKFTKEKWLALIPYMIISIMPFVWYVVASNHSYIHSWFTYRDLMITIFALSSYIAYLFEKDKYGKLKKEKSKTIDD